MDLEQRVERCRNGVWFFAGALSGYGCTPSTTSFDGRPVAQLLRGRIRTWNVPAPTPVATRVVLVPPRSSPGTRSEIPVPEPNRGARAKKRQCSRPEKACVHIRA